ncbi:hypothetical protein [Streptomyces sp. NPDC059701]|uniref:hypothetical protein n=1 Tax=Streptomyces sp. NPDC059701 TaxID=3346914 RepID=UPI00368445DE
MLLTGCQGAPESDSTTGKAAALTTARDAYDVLWDGYYSNQAGRTGQGARTLKLGQIGDAVPGAVSRGSVVTL